MKQLKEILRDERGIVPTRSQYKKTRFYIDNEFIDCEYADFLGKGCLVYFALARHAHAKTQECFPSYETLMSETGIKNRNAISKAITNLKRLGLIKVKRHKNRKSNLYILLDQSMWMPPSSIAIDTTEKVSKTNNKEYQNGCSSSIKDDTRNLQMKSSKEVEYKNNKGLEETTRWLEEKGIISKKDNPNLNQ